MNIAELSRIDRDIDIAAPPQRIWRALTSVDELSDWFEVTIEGSIAEGAEVWMTSTHPDYAGQRFFVRFAELNPPRRLVWEWHPGAVDASIDYSKEPVTRVTFSLEPSNDGASTRLRLSETGFDEISLSRRAKVYEDNTGGWTAMVERLKTHVEATR